MSHRTTLTFAGKEKPRLFPVCDRFSTEDAKWGYIDSDGRLVISLQFEQAEDFEQGLAAVRVGKKWGFVGEDGRYAINPQFDEAWSFSEHLAAFRLGDKWGFIDKIGKYAINPQFDAAYSFSEGLALVETGREWGFIDSEGKYAVNPQFDHAWPFSEGLASVKIGDKAGYINRDGKYAINLQFDEAWSFSEHLAAFRFGDKWGFIDKNGKYAINPQFDGVQSFSEGLAPVQTGDKWGYVDKDGRYAINPQFEGSREFSEGLAAVQIGDKWGFIDKNGKIVINPEFTTELRPFRRGLAAISPLPAIYVNTKAQWVWPNRKAFQSDVAQLFPLLEADRAASGGGGDLVEVDWSQCVNGVTVRPVCCTVQKGEATGFGQVIFRDKKSAQKAAELHFDGLFFDGQDGRTLFGMKPTADGWVSFPGIPPAPFMLETMPSLPELPAATNAGTETP
jgi:hypothetical protein